MSKLRIPLPRQRGQVFRDRKSEYDRRDGKGVDLEGGGCMVKQVRVSLKDLNNDEGSGGLEIIIPEALGDPMGDPSNSIPIFIEYYKGDLRVLIWNGEQDPEVHLIKLKGE